jgi:hypothetical protein
MLEEVRRCEGVISSNPRIFEVVTVPYIRVFDEERHGGRRGKLSVSSENDNGN